MLVLLNAILALLLLTTRHGSVILLVLPPLLLALGALPLVLLVQPTIYHSCTRRSSAATTLLKALLRGLYHSYSHYKPQEGCATSCSARPNQDPPSSRRCAPTRIRQADASTARPYQQDPPCRRKLPHTAYLNPDPAPQYSTAERSTPRENTRKRPALAHRPPPRCGGWNASSLLTAKSQLVMHL